ncbi:MAG: DUF5686 family protein [Crocinitomicaceae bacterium]|jgi:hypothetical protein
MIRFFLLFLLLLLINENSICQKDSVLQFKDIVIKKKTKRDWGKEIIRKAIERRQEIEKKYSNFEVDIYSISKIDKEKKDSLETFFVRESQMEWKSKSYFELRNTKDVYQVYNDYGSSGRVELHGNPNVGTSTDFFGGGRLAPRLAIDENPYIFVKGIKEAFFNLYQNYIEASHLCAKPIVSPIADNAFLYYRFDLVNTKLDPDFGVVNEIKVTPIFDYEPLLKGTIWIDESNSNVVRFTGSINGNSLLFIKSLTIDIEYTKSSELFIPKKFNYDFTSIDNRKMLLGNTSVYFTNYQFFDIPKGVNFWKETKVFDLKPLDTNFRPADLKVEDEKFVRSMDSIRSYKSSKEYLDKQDDSINKIYWLDVLWNGVSFRNSFSKQRIWFGGLISQVVPFGVGGYRHRLNVFYDKEFQNGNKITLQPTVDYGFYNKDLKGELALAYDFDQLKLRRITFLAGDIYDFVNSFQNIAGAFGPSNRVRNQKVGFSYRSELVNGLFVKYSFDFSNRMSITNVQYPEWVNYFGMFSKPLPFDNYKVSILGVEVEYQPFQKYIIKEQKKILLDSKWPLFGLKYITGVPSLFGGQSNYGYLEAKITQQAKLAALGNYQFRLVGGQFLYKKDLRLIEYKYFRTSDIWFLSNPVTSMQMLDTLLSTTNSYFQANFIHHFEGYFLNKVWLLNRLKLEETVGAAFLTLPQNNYALVEVFAGIERKVKISKYLWKFGLFWTSSISSNRLGASHLKIGINFYDTFHKQWLY